MEQRFPILLLMLGLGALAGQADDTGIQDLLKSAPVTAAPTSQPQTATQPISTSQPAESAPERARLGIIVLSDQTRLAGPIWTTLATPLRVWEADQKVYHDVDWDVVAKIEVVDPKSTMEDDWRWLKEGSNEKVLSGKQYPLVQASYRLTLTQGEVVLGTVVAPISCLVRGQRVNLALHKKWQGELGQKLSDLRYISSIELAPAATTAPARRSTQLPLLD
ncbi:MAG: hypothetical protein WCJ97_03075 [Phycisphaerae bacterium]